MDPRDAGRALTSALKVQDLALSLYTNGLDNYLNVTVAQVAALSSELATVEPDRVMPAKEVESTLRRRRQK